MAEATAPFLEGVGGRVLLAVEAQQMVIGPEALEWDMVLMVEYPSREKFLQMATDPGVPGDPRAPCRGARRLEADRLRAAQRFAAGTGSVGHLSLGTQASPSTAWCGGCGWCPR